MFFTHSLQHAHQENLAHLKFIQSILLWIDVCKISASSSLIETQSPKARNDIFQVQDIKEMLAIFTKLQTASIDTMSPSQFCRSFPLYFGTNLLQQGETDMNDLPIIICRALF